MKAQEMIVLVLYATALVLLLLSYGVLSVLPGTGTATGLMVLNSALWALGLVIQGRQYKRDIELQGHEDEDKRMQIRDCAQLLNGVDTQVSEQFQKLHEELDQVKCIQGDAIAGLKI